MHLKPLFKRNWCQFSHSKLKREVKLLILCFQPDHINILLSKPVMCFFITRQAAFLWYLHHWTLICIRFIKQTRILSVRLIRYFPFFIACSIISLSFMCFIWHKQTWVKFVFAECSFILFFSCSVCLLIIFSFFSCYTHSVIYFFAFFLSQVRDVNWKSIYSS